MAAPNLSTPRILTSEFGAHASVMVRCVGEVVMRAEDGEHFIMEDGRGGQITVFRWNLEHPWIPASKYVEVIGQVSDDGSPSLGAVKVYDFGSSFNIDLYNQTIDLIKKPKLNSIFQSPVVKA